MALVASSQPNKTLDILAQNYIRLEPSPFRSRPLDFLVQNFRPFTTPSYHLFRSNKHMVNLIIAIAKGVVT